MARHGEHLMIGSGGVAKVPLSESAELGKAIYAIEHSGDLGRALSILKRLERQVEGGYHRNPSSSRLYEPFKIIALLGREVDSIAYIHAEDGKPYKHDFKRGSAEVYAVERHSRKELLIASPSRVPLWDEF